MPEIVADDVSVEFSSGPRDQDKVVALSHVSTSIQDQTLVCMIGPSGCGKTTLLNMIAGFIQPTSGTISVGGSAVSRPGPDRGVVFQDANIFPWLTVAKNVAFGPRIQKKYSRRELKQRVGTYLERVGLADFRDSLPLALSGGMKQRVALARVLINEPPILLMDEPFGALDAQTRIVMQELLLELWERDKKTVVFVTHDIEEALLLGDEVVIMDRRPGRVKGRLRVPFPRPRGYDITGTPEFAELRQYLLGELHLEPVKEFPDASSLGVGRRPSNALDAIDT